MTEERDPKVSQRYRDLGREEPPRALDEKILAAARGAVDKPHAPLVVPAGRHRWYYSLAAAAIVVLAVAITLHLEREQPDPEVIPPLPIPQTAKQASAPPPLTQERREAAQASRPAPRVPAKPAATFTPEPAPSAGVAADSMASRAAAEQQAAAEAARAREEVSPAPSAARAMARLAIEPPERWLERIADLRKQGRHDEADKALAEFRKQYPGYRIPEPMLEKVEKRQGEK